MKSGVYIIKNKKNNSVYIGSSIYIKCRISQHKYTFKNNKNSNKHLQSFYNKYGLDVFIFEVLEYCEKYLLKEREQYYLNKYKNKFNISEFSASTKGVKCSEEKKRKISESLKKAGLKGIPKSEETKKRMRKPKSEEHKLKIKKAQEKVMKKVYQYDINKNLINEFNSITSAEKETNFTTGGISSACNKKQKTAYGFIWSFKKL